MKVDGGLRLVDGVEGYEGGSWKRNNGEAWCCSVEVHNEDWEMKVVVKMSKENKGMCFGYWFPMG